MQWIIDHRTVELTALFSFFTSLGDAGFFLVFVAAGYWLWRPVTFARFGLLVLGSTILSVSLKELFEVPRPDLSPLIAASGWSFPSGHAQTAAAIWPWLALELGRHRGGRGRLWRWSSVVVVVAGVAMSRVYLGVHTPRDVVAGVAVGVGLAAVAWRLARQPPGWWQGLGRHRQSAAVALAVVAWCLVVLPASADPAAPAAAGALAGFWIGSLYRRDPGSALPASGWRPLVAVAIGIGVMVALRGGLKELFVVWGPRAPWADLIRYLAIGAWIGLGAPSLFRALGLARPEAETDTGTMPG